jgi:Leucine-rich repeat (LRR) protein
LAGSPTCDDFGQCEIENFEQNIDLSGAIYNIDRPYDAETKLEISNSIVKRLPTNFFSIWPNLKKLVADNCGLEELPANGINLTQLTSLVMGHNQLTELHQNSFAGAENLEELLLSYNQIVNITFGNLTKLETLHLAGNKIEIVRDGTFKNLRSLRAIHMDNNRLKYFDFTVFRSNSQLELVGLQRNNLVRIDAPVIGSVHTLFLDHNLLINVAALENFTSLVALNVNGNRNLDYLTLNLTRSSLTLERLNLSETSLHVTNGHFRFLDGLDNLKELAIGANNFTELNLSIFPRLVGLKQFLIAKNQLRSIISFGLLQEKFPNLTSFEVFENPWNCTFAQTLKFLKFIDRNTVTCQKEQTRRGLLWAQLGGAVLVIVICLGIFVAWIFVKRPAQAEPAPSVPLNTTEKPPRKPYLRYESTVQELSPIFIDDNPKI